MSVTHLKAMLQSFIPNETSQHPVHDKPQIETTPHDVRREAAHELHTAVTTQQMLSTAPIKCASATLSALHARSLDTVYKSMCMDSQMLVTSKVSSASSHSKWHLVAVGSKQQC
eukprot:5513319-Amphidinium_carterae.1